LLPMLYMVLSTYHPRMSAVSRSFCCIVPSCGRRAGGARYTGSRAAPACAWARMHRAATGCIGLQPPVPRVAAASG
jgi:hypothetical protein